MDESFINARKGSPRSKLRALQENLTPINTPLALQKKNKTSEVASPETSKVASPETSLTKDIPTYSGKNVSVISIPDVTLGNISAWNTSVNSTEDSILLGKSQNIRTKVRHRRISNSSDLNEKGQAYFTVSRDMPLKSNKTFDELGISFGTDFDDSLDVSGAKEKIREMRKRKRGKGWEPNLSTQVIDEEVENLKVKHADNILKADTNISEELDNTSASIEEYKQNVSKVRTRKSRKSTNFNIDPIISDVTSDLSNKNRIETEELNNTLASIEESKQNVSNARTQRPKKSTNFNIDPIISDVTSDLSDKNRIETEELNNTLASIEESKQNVSNARSRRVSKSINFSIDPILDVPSNMSSKKRIQTDQEISMDDQEVSMDNINKTSDLMEIARNSACEVSLEKMSPEKIKQLVKTSTGNASDTSFGNVSHMSDIDTTIRGSVHKNSYNKVGNLFKKKRKSVNFAIDDVISDIRKINNDKEVETSETGNEDGNNMEFDKNDNIEYNEKEIRKTPIKSVSPMKSSAEANRKSSAESPVKSLSHSFSESYKMFLTESMKTVVETSTKFTELPQKSFTESPHMTFSVEPESLMISNYENVNHLSHAGEMKQNKAASSLKLTEEDSSNSSHEKRKISTEISPRDLATFPKKQKLSPRKRAEISNADLSISPAESDKEWFTENRQRITLRKSTEVSISQDQERVSPKKSTEVSSSEVQERKSTETFSSLDQLIVSPRKSMNKQSVSPNKTFEESNSSDQLTVSLRKSMNKQSGSPKKSTETFSSLDQVSVSPRKSMNKQSVSPNKTFEESNSSDQLTVSLRKSMNKQSGSPKKSTETFSSLDQVSVSPRKSMNKQSVSPNKTFEESNSSDQLTVSLRKSMNKQSGSPKKSTETFSSLDQVSVSPRKSMNKQSVSPNKTFEESNSSDQLTVSLRKSMNKQSGSPKKSTETFSSLDQLRGSPRKSMNKQSVSPNKTFEESNSSDQLTVSLRKSMNKQSGSPKKSTETFSSLDQVSVSPRKSMNKQSVSPNKTFEESNSSDQLTVSLRKSMNKQSGSPKKSTETFSSLDQVSVSPRKSMNKQSVPNKTFEESNSSDQLTVSLRKSMNKQSGSPKKSTETFSSLDQVSVSPRKSMNKQSVSPNKTFEESNSSDQLTASPRKSMNKQSGSPKKSTETFSSLDQLRGSPRKSMNKQSVSPNKTFEESNSSDQLTVSLRKSMNKQSGSPKKSTETFSSLDQLRGSPRKSMNKQSVSPNKTFEESNSSDQLTVSLRKSMNKQSGSPKKSTETFSSLDQLRGSPRKSMNKQSVSPNKTFEESNSSDQLTVSLRKSMNKQSGSPKKSTETFSSLDQLRGSPRKSMNKQSVSPNKTFEESNSSDQLTVSLRKSMNKQSGSPKKSTETFSSLDQLRGSPRKSMNKQSVSPNKTFEESNSSDQLTVSLRKSMNKQSGSPKKSTETFSSLDQLRGSPRKSMNKQSVSPNKTFEESNSSDQLTVSLRKSMNKQSGSPKKSTETFSSLDQGKVSPRKSMNKQSVPNKTLEESNSSDQLTVSPRKSMNKQSVSPNKAIEESNLSDQIKEQSSKKSSNNANKSTEISISPDHARVSPRKSINKQGVSPKMTFEKSNSSDQGRVQSPKKSTNKQRVSLRKSTEISSSPDQERVSPRKSMNKRIASSSKSIEEISPSKRQKFDLLTPPTEFNSPLRRKVSPRKLEENSESKQIPEKETNTENQYSRARKSIKESQTSSRFNSRLKSVLSDTSSDASGISVPETSPLKKKNIKLRRRSSVDFDINDVIFNVQKTSERNQQQDKLANERLLYGNLTAMNDNPNHELSSENDVNDLDVEVESNGSREIQIKDLPAVNELTVGQTSNTYGLRTFQNKSNTELSRTLTISNKSPKDITSNKSLKGAIGDRSQTDTILSRSPNKQVSETGRKASPLTSPSKIVPNLQSSSLHSLLSGSLSKSPPQQSPIEPLRFIDDQDNEGHESGNQKQIENASELLESEKTPFSFVNKSRSKLSPKRSGLKSSLRNYSNANLSHQSLDNSVPQISNTSRSSETKKSGRILVSSLKNLSVNRNKFEDGAVPSTSKKKNKDEEASTSRDKQKVGGQLTLKEFLEKMSKNELPREKEPDYLGDMLKKPEILLKLDAVKTTKTKSPKSKKGPPKLIKNLPPKLNSSVFKHFLKHKLPKESEKIVQDLTEVFFTNLSNDLAVILASTKDKMINKNHVYMLMKELKMVDCWEGMYALLQDLLPANEWKKVVPIRYAFNKVYPKPKK